MCGSDAYASGGKLVDKDESKTRRPDMRQWKVIRQQYRRIALILSAVALCCLAGWKVAEVRQIRVYVPGGVFLMGDQSGVGFSDERPAHWVRVSPFHILANEVSAEQYARFLNVIGAHPTGREVRVNGRKYAELKRSGVKYESGRFMPSGRADLPVLITWYGAEAYCRWQGGRLPSEAQWEYAARAGTVTEYPWGEPFDDAMANGRDTIDEYKEVTFFKKRWVESDGSVGVCMAGNDVPKKTTVPRGELQPVGRYPANKWGLYDMIGNAAEWCQDWYSDDYYCRCGGDRRDTAVLDPSGPSYGHLRMMGPGEWKVVRGGWYRSDRLGLRCASRTFGAAEQYEAGFRCVFPVAKQDQGKKK